MTQTTKNISFAVKNIFALYLCFFLITACDDEPAEANIDAALAERPASDEQPEDDISGEDPPGGEEPEEPEEPLDPEQPQPEAVSQDPPAASLSLNEQLSSSCSFEDSRCKYQILKSKNPETANSLEVVCSRNNKTYKITNYTSTPGQGLLCDLVDSSNGNMLLFAWKTRNWCENNWKEKLKCPEPEQQPAEEAETAEEAGAAEEPNPPSPDPPSPNPPPEDTFDPQAYMRVSPPSNPKETTSASYTIDNHLQGQTIAVTVNGRRMPFTSCVSVFEDQWTNISVSLDGRILECVDSNNDRITCSPGHYRTEMIQRGWFRRSTPVLKTQDTPTQQCPPFNP